jgi:hypothetical protein
MIKVALDFAPGTHGHFLEYVLNKYIFKVPSTKENIFQSSGSCHPINIDAEYQKHKMVYRLHYSSYDHAYPSDATHVIFIKHHPKLDFLLLTNIFHRCDIRSGHVDDFNVEDIKKLHLEFMNTADSTSNVSLRSDWYAKLMERHFHMTEKKHETELPLFDFDFSSFFTLSDFLEELSKVATFLNHTFEFDSSLIALYNEFLERNQGYQAYRQGNQLFEHIVAGDNVDFDSDWQLRAYLNVRLSTVFKLYDHPDLFDKDSYPTNTKDIHKILMDHLANFDKRF